MSNKRSRATYEADLQSKQSPFVVYGTPLPPIDADVRDDGSYVPVWKQEVTDEKGRKRLHGAFTGGFSAGYFNTVGSKEGWTPSTFVSSRGSRKKDDTKAAPQRPEDFMDDEDLAEAAEAQALLTAKGFAGLGSTNTDESRQGAFIDLFKSNDETMGVKLLKRMGWREGQGIGPKTRRRARLDGVGDSGCDANRETHLFAPDNTPMVSFVKKMDHKGLGYSAEPSLSSTNLADPSAKSEEEGNPFGTAVSIVPKKKKKAVRGGIGIGILNDTGSDDEDPYEIGPRIAYNRVIGGDKKKKKPVLNGAVRPVFISKKAAILKASAILRKCHDGRLPLDGFVLSSEPDSIITSDGKYQPPNIPEGWVSAKRPASDHATSGYLSTADVAKTSKLDPKSRATLLGEAPLPGKSVFDYLSTAARARLVAVSGNTNLPTALGEVPRGYALTDEERRTELLSQIPKLDKDVAVSALSRSSSGWMPYAEDEGKRNRYRAYLEGQAGIRQGLPERATGVTNDDWLKELREFAHCAQIFKPISGLMASRFTSSSSARTLEPTTLVSTDAESLLSKPVPKPEDPAEAAAKVGMFGPMTRSSQNFYPTRLLCKRFNVKPPAHVQLDPNGTTDDSADGRSASGFQSSDGQPAKSLDLISKSSMDDIMRASGGRNPLLHSTGLGSEDIVPSAGPEPTASVVIDAERNNALEGEKAGEAVFKAIFGDSDEEDD